MIRQILFPAFGAAVVLAGADKLLGDRGYLRMFRHLGWSRGGMQAMAAAEIAGGALIGLPSTRALGGAVLAATSATVLFSEVRQGDGDLAGPRALVLLGGLLAALSGRRG